MCKMILQRKNDILLRQQCGTVRYWRSELAGGKETRHELVGDGLDMVEGTIFFTRSQPQENQARTINEGRERPRGR